MSSLNEKFGWEKSRQQYTLAAKDGAEVSAMAPVSLRRASEEKRPPMEELEAASRHPAAEAATNLFVDSIMATKHKIGAESEEVKEYFEDFIEQVGTWSSRSWRRWVEDNFRFRMVYGICPTERLYNEDDEDEVIDLEIIDPKSFGYAKNSFGQIVLDEYGRPIGYTQKQGGLGSDTEGDPLPSDDILLANQIYLDKKRVALYKGITLGNGFYPHGLVEPAYENIQRHNAAHKSYINLIYRYPLLVGSVGDENNPPRPEHIDAVAKKLKNANFNNSLTLAHYNKIQVHYPDIRRLVDVFNNLELQIIEAMCGPVSLVRGTGESESRATLKIIASGKLILKCQKMMADFSEFVEKEIFKPMAEYKGFDEVPKLVWDELEVPGLKSLEDSKEETDIPAKEAEIRKKASEEQYD